MSLDNADTVIEGAPGFAVFETWDLSPMSRGEWPAGRQDVAISQPKRAETPNGS